VSVSAGGEDPCRYHRQVLLKWYVKGQYSFSTTPKAIKIEQPKSALGRIECRALGEDGRCQIDFRTCPTNLIIESIVLRKPPRPK